MGSHDHQMRYAVVHPGQHPMRHRASEVVYESPIPGLTTLGSSLDWLFAVLYPRSADPVATVADLPAVGNTLLDFRIVEDDGDGKAAGYRWERREGDAAAKWYKIYDMDWGSGAVLSMFLDRTQDLYAYKNGSDDLDSDGAALTGVDAGQHIYGGASASTHLTLHANAGDGVGAQTGYIQMADNVRPAADASWALGTTGNRWTNVWSALLTAGTLTLGAGSISDSSGAISFDDENLTTTGTLSAGAITGTSLTAITGADSLVLDVGTITDTTGAISFGDENLSTTGTLASGTHTIETLVLGAGSITDTGGEIDFADENLATTGTLAALSGTFSSFAQGGNLRLAANVLSSQDVDGNITLTPNGTGVVVVSSSLTTAAINATGTVGVTGQLNVDNLRLDGNSLSSTDVDGNVALAPNGAGLVTTSAMIQPTADGTLDLGATASRWNSIYLGGGLSDGTDAVTIATLLSLRDINVGVDTGYSLFWTGSKWEASAPDTEIDHAAISGLGDDDHTQYALLAGRSSGQTLKGGTAASENLTLHSTDHATKGSVFWAGTLSPLTDATYDIGDATHLVKDIYVTGQLLGARLANHTTAGRPSASAGTKGRVIYDTDLEDVFIDRGGTWKKLSLEKYVTQDASGWDGVATSVVYTVSSEMSDARECIWVLYSNTDTFEQINCVITKSQTQVTVSVTTPLPAGTYTLVGIG